MRRDKARMSGATLGPFQKRVDVTAFGGCKSIEVDGEVVAELGPGTIIGERALLEDGVRSATVRTKTPAKIVRVPGDRLEQEDLAALAAGRNREER